MSEALETFHAREEASDEELLLGLWDVVNDGGLPASPPSRSEKIRRARAWVQKVSLELAAALCKKEAVKKYCADGELTNVVILAVLEETVGTYGLSAGVAIALVIFRQGLSSLCKKII